MMDDDEGSVEGLPAHLFAERLNNIKHNDCMQLCPRSLGKTPALRIRRRAGEAVGRGADQRGTERGQEEVQEPQKRREMAQTKEGASRHPFVTIYYHRHLKHGFVAR